ncbi:MAG: nucleoside hydrolase [Acidimicrobiales bacterium]
MTETFAELWQSTLRRHNRVERWRALKFRSALVAVAASVGLAGYAGVATGSAGGVSADLAGLRPPLEQPAAWTGSLPADDSPAHLAVAAVAPRPERLPVIFDTDMVNSIDDSLALAMLHGYEDRGMIDLLAVTVSYDDPAVAPYIDAVNTWYGHPDVTIAVIGANGVDEGRDAFHRQVAADARFPHDITESAQVDRALSQLRRRLAAEADHSVVIVSTGFSTNLAQLLASPADDVSPLDGHALAAAKVKLLAVSAGDVVRGQPEFNTARDPLSARIVFDQWPTPVVVDEWHVGANLPFPTEALGDSPDNPVLAAAVHYGANALLVDFPYRPPSFDPATVLAAVEPGTYLGVGEPGHVTIDEQLVARFAPDPGGNHRVLQRPTDPAATAAITARFAELVSHP